MSVANLQKAVEDTCKAIAENPSWFQNFKYNKLTDKQKLSGKTISIAGYSSALKEEQYQCPQGDSNIWDECYGTYNYDNGNIYKGGWKDDKFHGK